MDVFSLEDEEYSDMILTQSSKLSDVSNNGGILPDPMDFEMPCISLICKSQPQYSNISDDDFVDIPCSQVPNKLMGGEQW